MPAVRVSGFPAAAEVGNTELAADLVRGGVDRRRRRGVDLVELRELGAVEVAGVPIGRAANSGAASRSLGRDGGLRPAAASSARSWSGGRALGRGVAVCDSIAIDGGELGAVVIS